MAQGYSLQALGVFDGTVPQQMGDGSIVGSDVRHDNIVVTGASLLAQGAGLNVNDTTLLYTIRRGALFSELKLQTDTAFTGATISIGTAANPTKYGSVAGLAANTPTSFRPVAVRVAGQYTADEPLIMTVTGAALPSAFNLEMTIAFCMAY